MEIDVLESSIQEYEYGRYDFAERNISFHFNKKRGYLTMKNFFHNNPTHTHGLCHELAMSARRKLNEQFPHLYIHCVNGHDDKFFLDEFGSSHTYLMIGEKDLTPMRLQGNSQGLMQHLMEHAVVVDPSAQLVEPFANSKYDALEIMGQYAHVDVPKTVRLHRERWLPLAMSPNKWLVGMCYEPKNQCPVDFVVQFPNKKPTGLEVDDPLWDEKFESIPKVYGIIQHLRSVIPK